jgi:hypothetical protein
MASTIRSHRADAGLWKMLAIGVFGLLAFIWWDTYTAAGARAALEKVGHAGRNEEIRRVRCRHRCSARAS